MISTINSIVYPLYRKTTEKEKFDKALIYLTKDIEQLLISVGLNYEPKKHFLENLNNFFLQHMWPINIQI